MEYEKRLPEIVYLKEWPEGFWDGYGNPKHITDEMIQEGIERLKTWKEDSCNPQEAIKTP